jgi:hypothetical protein
MKIPRYQQPLSSTEALSLQSRRMICHATRHTGRGRRARVSTRKAAVGYREFVDDAGTSWRVWDTRPMVANTLRAVSPGFAGGWLTFESRDERRRLAPIPPDWEFVTREQMTECCTRASPARHPDTLTSEDRRGLAGRS